MAGGIATMRSYVSGLDVYIRDKKGNRPWPVSDTYQHLEQFASL